MRNSSLVFFLVFLLATCKKPNSPEPDIETPPLYFPPASGTEWQTITPGALGWHEPALNNLYTYLESKGTKGFIILKDGKLVTEKYFGGFTGSSLWYWASAGKMLTAMLVGIAQEEGKLQLSHATTRYLGAGWTSLLPAKEAAITIRHQLTMTTGLDDAVPDENCTTPVCLGYKADAGTRWAYHNAPYTLLEQVVEAATGTTYSNYFGQKIKDPIGMNGSWIKNGFNNVYYSNVRSAARYGLLLLNKGVWNGKKVLGDAAYLAALTNSSQNLNLSYGYLTWLNGKASHRLPNTQAAFAGMLIPNAPTDLYAALGKNDQKVYVVPSQNLVVIRMGEDAGQSRLALSSFDKELWGYLKTVIDY